MGTWLLGYLGIWEFGVFWYLGTWVLVHFRTLVDGFLGTTIDEYLGTCVLG